MATNKSQEVERQMMLRKVAQLEDSIKVGSDAFLQVVREYSELKLAIKMLAAAFMKQEEIDLVEKDRKARYDLVLAQRILQRLHEMEPVTINQHTPIEEQLKIV